MKLFLYFLLSCTLFSCLLCSKDVRHRSAAKNIGNIKEDEAVVDISEATVEHKYIKRNMGSHSKELRLFFQVMAAALFVAVVFTITLFSLLPISNINESKQDDEDRSFRRTVESMVKHLKEKYPDDSDDFPLTTPNEADFVNKFGVELGPGFYKIMCENMSLPAGLTAEQHLTIGRMFPKSYWIDQVMSLKPFDPKLDQIGAFIGHPKVVFLVLHTLPAKTAIEVVIHMIRYLDSAKAGMLIDDYQQLVHMLNHGRAFRDPSSFWSVDEYRHEPEYVQSFLKKLIEKYEKISFRMQNGRELEFVRIFGEQDGKKVYQQIVVDDELIDNVTIVDSRLADLVDVEYWLEQMMRARDSGNIHYDSILLISKAIGAPRAAFLAGLVFTESELPIVTAKLLPEF